MSSPRRLDDARPSFTSVGGLPTAPQPVAAAPAPWHHAAPGPGGSFDAWQGLLDAMLDAVWLVDARELRVVASNRAGAALVGLAPLQLVGMHMDALAASPEDLCFWAEAAAGRIDSIESETLVLCEGSAVPVTRRVSRIGSDAASNGLYVVVLHDRREQVRIQRQLEEVGADLRATLESTHDGILVTDLRGRIRNFNRRFAALWDMPAELPLRRHDDAVFEWMRRAVTDPPSYMRRLAALEDAPQPEAVDVVLLQSGRVLERIIRPQVTDGRTIGRVISFRDITETMDAQQRIKTLSYTDPLTGLPNRRLLADRVEQALAMARRDGTRFALLFLNLDRFSHLNDNLGRVYADRVLLDVAGRIKGCMRQVDTVARLGTDEFVVLAHQADEAGAERAARRLLEALERPFTQGGMSFSVTASIGIALHPKDGAGIDELLHRAEAAMRDVKGAGRAAFRFHEPRPAEAELQSRESLQLDHAMRQGLAAGQFRLHYQPQIELATGRIAGAEVLLRWRHPERGEVSPAEFVRVAEESGFILAIDQWVLRQAVAQAAAWHAAGRAVPISINVSGLQFRQPHFVDDVAALLAETGLPPRLIELEVTESILIGDGEQALRRLGALAALGLTLAIDDFGVGYSSIAYLKRFPIARLKIDRSFIEGLPGDAGAVGIVEAIVHMGRSFGLEVVAEGVETEAQRAFLERCGCRFYQGFLFAPALDLARFEERLGAAPREPPP